ncbi:MAG: hypothetical protein R2764_06755 [Bacteroidales bacterium]
MVDKLSTNLLTGISVQVILLSFIFCFLFLNVEAQDDTLGLHAPDSVLFQPDSAVVDSAGVYNYFLKISPNAIDSRVDYKAVDSIKFDVNTQKVYMYRENDISYEEINLKADYV